MSLVQPKKSLFWVIKLKMMNEYVNIFIAPMSSRYNLFSKTNNEKRQFNFSPKKQIELPRETKNQNLDELGFRKRTELLPVMEKVEFMKNDPYERYRYPLLQDHDIQGYEDNIYRLKNRNGNVTFYIGYHVYFVATRHGYYQVMTPEGAPAPLSFSKHCYTRKNILLK